MHQIGLSLVRCPLRMSEDILGLMAEICCSYITKKNCLLARKISESGSELSVECTSFTDPWLGLGALISVLGGNVVSTKGGEPFVHSVDLVFVFTLSVTFIDVALGPLSETSGDLLDADHWVSFVVSHETVFIIETAVSLITIVGSSVSGFQVWSELGIWIGTTVGKVVGIEVAALFTLIGSEHSSGIVLELVLPAINRRQVWQVVGQPLM